MRGRAAPRALRARGSWVEKLKASGKLESNDVDLAAFATKLAPVHDEFASAAKATDIVAKIKAL